MQSSSEQYFEKLDHIRALAAFMVFTWHFIHAAGVPVGYVPTLPVLSLIEEGHTGVSLFMTLSGYLFAKLLDGRQIIYKNFLRNRSVRLLPLLAFVLLITAAGWVANGTPVQEAAAWIALGSVLPMWPNGAWSITVEWHFYLILPALLFIVGIRRESALMLIFAAIGLRLSLFIAGWEIQPIGYWTIIGHFDQFVAGIYAWHLYQGTRVRPLVILAVAMVFVTFYHGFNISGGFYGSQASPVWIYLPAAEAAFYAVMIAAYDGSKLTLPKRLSASISFVGTVSYSIYLLHFWYYGPAAKMVTQYLGLLPFGLSLLCSLLAFVLFLPIAALSYRCIEQPFLKLRKRYARRGPHFKPEGSYTGALR
ncbi:acyltransferase family protein [Ensifer sesbaniae]|uniref:acyltransferase family protein n=1 Tax=Ensifer sesbaniae TaxID=1214071 RepID=UPI0015684999|nr:acyltransferase [Ensifer sesbaniae]